MKITKEKVITFFEDGCSKEEAEAIHRCLIENPAVLHDFFPEEEWMAFQVMEDLPPDWSQKVWKKIQAGKALVSGTMSTGPAGSAMNTTVNTALVSGTVNTVLVNGAASTAPVNGRLSLLYIVRTAVAIAAMGAGFFILKQYAGGKADPGVKLANVLPSGSSLPLKNRDTVLINRTSRIRKDTLTDGSVVELSPASRLKFQWNFERDKRSITLSGEALFNVARETYRPFTVITSGFTTTVLGTVFRIKAYTDKNKATVQLLKGKVIVRNLTHPSQAKFLLDGQECVFDNSKNSLSMSTNESPAAQTSITNTGLPVDNSLEETDKEVLFKHLPLPRVFTILSKTYHTPILFTDADLRKRNFTGSIEKDQTLEDALNTIAQLNDLLVTRQDGSYRITLRQ
jgi:transmembrane sensor